MALRATDVTIALSRLFRLIVFLRDVYGGIILSNYYLYTKQSCNNIYL